MAATQDDVISLLNKNKRNGIDMNRLVTKLDSNIREVKPIIIQLQNTHQVVSGLKKRSGSPMYFERLYYGVPNRRSRSQL